MFRALFTEICLRDGFAFRALFVPKSAFRGSVIKLLVKPAGRTLGEPAAAKTSAQPLKKVEEDPSLAEPTYGIDDS